MKKKTDSYYDKTKYFPSSGNLYLAIQISNKYKKHALDLGSGAFRDTKLLINSGFKVDAVDFNPVVENYIKFSEFLPKDVFNLYKQNIINFKFRKNYYDIVNAQNVFTFIPKVDTLKIIQNINNSLKKNGIFIGNFIGKQDWSLKLEWKDKLVYYTKPEIQKLFSDFTFIRLNEIKENQPDLDGELKFIHEFDFIVIKP